MTFRFANTLDSASAAGTPVSLSDGQAYSMMSGDQALSVGKELLLHVSNIIVETSRLGTEHGAGEAGEAWSRGGRGRRRRR